jgi:hypothetical protein
MSTRVQKTIFLPTKGNLAVVANDTPLFNPSLKLYNLAPGQIGFFDAQTNLALDAAGIVDSKEVFIAIGVGAAAGQPTKSVKVRMSNGESLTPCLIDYANVDAPEVGSSNKAKFNFSCTDCSTSYSIGVKVQDPTLNFFYPENRYHVETISVQSENCPTCDGDCDYTHDGAEVLAKFKAAILSNELLSKYVGDVRTSEDSALPITPDAGFDFALEITFKVNTADCGCFPRPESIMQRYTIGSIITILNSGWAPNSTKSTVDMSTLQMPKGVGADLQWEEYMEMPGGTGFDGLNNEVETTGAPYYSQLEVSRTKNLLVDCETSYCQYSVGHRSSSPNEDANGHNWNPNFITSILIPEGDAATKTSVEGVLNAFITSGPCKKVLELSC